MLGKREEGEEACGDDGGDDDGDEEFAPSLPPPSPTSLYLESSAASLPVPLEASAAYLLILKSLSASSETFPVTKT